MTVDLWWVKGTGHITGNTPFKKNEQLGIEKGCSVADQSAGGGRTVGLIYGVPSGQVGAKIE